MGKPTQQRKAEIIQSTLKLAATRGITNVTTLAIAEDVGVAHATVFRHFKTREEIFSAALKSIIEHMFANLEPVFTSPAQADERLRLLIKTQLDFVSRNRGLPRLLFSDQLHKESEVLKGIVKTAMRQFTNRIAGLISEGIGEGVFTRDIQAGDSAKYLIALFQGLMMRWSVFDFEFQITAESEPLWRFFSHSLKPQPVPSRL